MAQNRKIPILLSALGMMWLTVCAAAAADAGKPQVPFQVMIAPVSKTVNQKSIKPGDTIELKVIVEAPSSDAEMHVQIELLGGAELVSGDLSWRGILAKREKKQLVLSVRAPRSGIGTVSVKVRVDRDGRTLSAREAVYLLGSGPAAAENSVMKPAGKDSRGRPVKEYR